MEVKIPIAILGCAAVIASIFLDGCETPAPAPKRKIVIIGDSLTFRGEQPKGFVSLLRERRPGLEIVARGRSGDKIRDVERRFSKDVTTRHPALVIVVIGVNDIWHNGATPEEFSEVLFYLLSRARTAGIEMAVCTPSLVMEDSDEFVKAGQAFAEVARRVTSAHNLRPCDLREAMIEEKSSGAALTVDGVHLNDFGNMVAARVLDEVIE